MGGKGIRAWEEGARIIIWRISPRNVFLVSEASYFRHLRCGVEMAALNLDAIGMEEVEALEWTEQK